MAGAVVSSLRLLPAGPASPEGGGAPPATEPDSGRERGADGGELRARSVGEILDTAFDVLVSRFGPCVGFAAIFLLPFRVGSELLSLDARMVWELTYLVPELLTTAFVCSLVGGHFLGRRVSAAHAFRDGLVALPGVGVVALGQVATMVGLACLCCLPFLLGYWAFAVVPVVYVLERDRWRASARASAPVGMRWMSGILLSIGRGFRLVSGLESFGRWLGWVAVAVLAVYWPLTQSATLLEHPLVEDFLHETLAMQGRAVALTLAILGTVFMGIGTAYLAILKTVYYLDLRVRKEALDLELTLARLERVHATGAARPAGSPGA